MYKMSNCCFCKSKLEELDPGDYLIRITPDGEPPAWVCKICYGILPESYKKQIIENLNRGEDLMKKTDAIMDCVNCVKEDVCSQKDIICRVEFLISESKVFIPQYNKAVFIKDIQKENDIIIIVDCQRFLAK